MDIKRPRATFMPAFVPNYSILTEDVKHIAYWKALLRSYTIDREHALRSFHKRLKESQRNIDVCNQESREIELQLNTVEMKIAEAFQLTQEAEAEALQTVKENGTIKRQIKDLKHDLNQQGRIIKRANEAMQAISKSCVRSNKKRKVEPDDGPT